MDPAQPHRCLPGPAGGGSTTGPTTSTGAVNNAEDDKDFTCSSWQVALASLDISTFDASRPLLVGNTVNTAYSISHSTILPKLLAIVTAVKRSYSNECFVRLKDPTGTIGATLTADVMVNEPDIGLHAVVVLEKVAVIRTPPPRSVPHLCITLDNIVQVIPASVGSPKPSQHNHLHHGSIGGGYNNTTVNTTSNNGNVHRGSSHQNVAINTIANAGNRPPPVRPSAIDAGNTINRPAAVPPPHREHQQQQQGAVPVRGPPPTINHQYQQPKQHMMPPFQPAPPPQQQQQPPPMQQQQRQVPPVPLFNQTTTVTAATNRPPTTTNPAPPAPAPAPQQQQQQQWQEEELYIGTLGTIDTTQQQQGVNTTAMNNSNQQQQQQQQAAVGFDLGTSGTAIAGGADELEVDNDDDFI